MRAGRLKTRRYKVRRGRNGWIFLLFLGALAAAAAYFFHSGDLPLIISPAPTLTPQESAADERIITLPGKTWYALQLGVFDQESSARQLAESYRGRGAGGFIAGSAPFRVLAAAYTSRADAQSVQNQLRTLHGVEAYINEIHRAEMTFKVTGQKAQLIALSDAYDAVDQAAVHFSTLSQGLDQRVMEETEILLALKSQKETLIALRDRLQNLFGPQPHAAVAQMMNLLSELSEAVDLALAAPGETRLGAQIKYCQLLCIIRMTDYAQALAA